ncbi:actin-related protein 2/3 complex, subunit 1, partial [Aureobasidium melanogenum]
MAAPQVHHLFHHPIADHSFSADRKTLAVARDNTVELYSSNGSRFALNDELRGHDKLITGVDIAPNSGKIVTCSQDRNAYVWEPSNGFWRPTLVLLRINRAATCVRWSPNETKFAVGSGARVAAICYFEEENDWWVSKHLKKPLRSTVTSVAWHPNSVLVALGSTDGHARVLSAFIKGVDERPAPSVWGERLPFNTICGEFLNQTAGWVKSVAFSPSGDAVAFVSHDSTMTVAYPAGEGQPPHAVINISTQVLPFADLLWISEGEIVCAGYDCEPFRFSGSASGWSLVGSLDSTSKSGAANQRDESALNMFRQMDLRGKVIDDTQLKTVHQNSISTVRAYAGSPDAVRQISTSGVDGRVVVWNL